MPPHCDSLDGPVVLAAKDALDRNDVELILPFVQASGDQKVREAFDLAARARAGAPEARQVADRWFFETAVRVHRAGEGAPFTGLKPAGLDVGPVIPVAERALEAESADELADVLVAMIREQIAERFGHVMSLKQRREGGLPASRAYTSAMLGLQVWAHGIYLQAVSGEHGHGNSHGNSHGHEHG